MLWIVNSKRPITGWINYSINFSFSNVFHFILLIAGLGWKPYTDCKGKKGKLACIPEIRKLCLENQSRVIKVIRFRLDAAQSLLQQDRSLRILHLFRDPRAIIFSRLHKTNWHPLKLLDGNYTPIIENAHSLCQKMLDDCKSGRKLMEEFPNRVIFIRYEDLNCNPSLIKEIKAAVGFKRRPGGVTITHMWVDHKSLRGKEPWLFWRRILSQLELEKVDAEYSEHYKVLGYIKLSHLEVKNLSKLSLVPDFDLKFTQQWDDDKTKDLQ